MSELEKLRAAQTIGDLSLALGCSKQKIRYLLYVKTWRKNYVQFEIPKRSGGTRKIHAPNDDLKALQRGLSRVLQDCIEEINQTSGRKNRFSHGFRRDGSIFTNARPHRNKRYVFNVDLKDFFPSINFGRVRGYLISNKNFQLHPTVATIVTQIACCDNHIPQGSPCSPVISNLIGHILDIQLSRLAMRVGCSYTRYADDLTFSTNKSVFPQELAARTAHDEHQWIAGDILSNTILSQGFTLNLSKTRMQYAGSTQRVTGLVVNKKVNVPSEYWRTTRSMCHRLFGGTESFKNSLFLETDAVKVTVKSTPMSRSSVNGRLNHIYDIERRHHKTVELEKSSKFRLYRKFLFYHHFFNPTRATVLLEGVTDSIYLKAAFERLKSNFPDLVCAPKGEADSECKLQYFKYTDKSDKLLSLAGGTGQINSFIAEYSKSCLPYWGAGRRKAVVVVLDNDSGSFGTFKMIKNFRNLPVCDGGEDFYYLGQNLYVVAIPKSGKADVAIEDLFDSSLRGTILGGKSFTKSNSYDTDKHYGKFIFATQVVKRNVDNINFDGFKGLFSRIQAAIEDWDKRQSKP